MHHQNRQHHHGPGETLEGEKTKTAKVLHFSYADDLNPLVISNGSSTQHQEVVKKVINTLEEEAANQGLSFDRSKESHLDFDRGPHKPSQATTLGVIITSNLNWKPHIKSRTDKATAALNTLTR